MMDYIAGFVLISGAIAAIYRGVLYARDLYNKHKPKPDPEFNIYWSDNRDDETTLRPIGSYKDLTPK